MTANARHRDESNPESLPFVSVVMPVRNEARFIANTLETVLQQDYPADRFEVIVADGMSDDGTQDILRDIEARYDQLRVITNQGRIVTTGLNVAINKAHGDVIIWLGGHALIARDYIRSNVALLDEHPEAWIVGGPLIHTADRRFGKAVAIAMSHPLGVGNANHHFADFEGYVEGAPFPAIRRCVFDRIGYFDERLVRNQDDEFYYRIRQAGGKIYVTPRTRCTYFVREHIGQLFRQQFQYSFWRIPVMRKHRQPTTLRQLVPSIFYITVLTLPLFGIWLKHPVIAVGLPAVYLSVLACAGILSTRKNGIAVAWRVPLAMATMHLAYAMGMIYGAGAVFLRPGSWNRKGSMATLNR